MEDDMSEPEKSSSHTVVEVISNHPPISTLPLTSTASMSNDVGAQIVEEKEIPESPALFDGDIVIKKAMPKEAEYSPSFGTVLKQNLYGNSVQYQPKTYNVRWESGNVVERVQPDQVSIVDRFVMRNTKLEKSAGISGTVRDWNVSTTVQIIGTTHVVEKVSLDRLRPITSYIRGQEILYQNWVGVISGVKRNIWFLLDGGMGFYVTVNEQDGFMRADPYWGVGMPCPGIRTKLNASVMRNAKWISGPMKFFSKLLPPLSYLYSKAHVTLNKSEVTEVEVKWLRLAPTIPVAINAPKPVTTLNPEMLRNVTVIGVPSSETIGINSVRMLKLRPEDSLTSYQFWLGAFKRKFIDGFENAEPLRSPISSTAPLRILATERVYEVPVKILSRSTIVEVAWNDGIVERVPSIKIPKILHRVEDNEFPSGMVVSPIYSKNAASHFHYYGVVLDSENFAKTKDRKVNVMWILNGNHFETTVESIFNLRPHQMYSMYERGTIVFPRVQGSTKFSSAVVSDLNIAVGKLVVTVSADHSLHEVYPHVVTPLSCRCFWNFFTRSWNVDELIVPPYQLDAEFGPIQRYMEIPEPSPNVLSNNNQDDALLIKSVWDEPQFEMLAFAPTTHRYYNCAPVGKFGKKFVDMIRNEIDTLTKFGSVPEGIWIRCYENRLDLISALLVGPSETPYEDGVFMFDLQVNDKFPASPPKIHYVSYSYELSPNMAWDGNFCVSALGWKNEINAEQSYIARCLKQIQALIFSPEPLLAGPRDFVDINSPRKKELSKLYNEFVVLRVLDSAWNMIHGPSEPWAALIKSHFSSVLPEKLAGYEHWDFSEPFPEAETDHLSHPKFPLFPASQGFQEAFISRLERFKKISPNIPATRTTSKTTLLMDITADSESVPVVDESKYEEPEMTIELVDPIPQIANDDILLALDVSKIQSPLESFDASSIQVPPSSTYSDKIVSTQPLDFEKNVIRVKGKSRSNNRKGKVLKELVNAIDSTALATESDTDEGGKLVVEKKEDEVVESASENEMSAK